MVCFTGLWGIYFGLQRSVEQEYLNIKTKHQIIIDSLDFKTSLNVRYESGYINRFVLLQQSLQKIRKNNNEIIRNKQNDKTKENYNQEYCETCE